MLNQTHKTHFFTCCDFLNLQPPHDCWEKIAFYIERLIAGNAHVNLIGTSDPYRIISRHIADSLAAVTWIQPNDTIIDIGTGAGLPGLIIRMWYPEVQLTLVDSKNKKIAFLENVIRDLDLTKTNAVWSRVEDLHAHPEFSRKYDTALTRAVGPVQQTLKLLTPLLHPKGRAIFYAGKKAEKNQKEVINYLKKSAVSNWNFMPYRIQKDEGCLVICQL